MENQNIRLTIISNPWSEEDNGFMIEVNIDGEDKSVLELDTDQMLRISGMLLKAIRTFINNTKINGQSTRKN